MKFRQYLSSILCGILLLAATASQAEKPIRIGTTQSLTGQFEEFGNAQMKGLKMWVDDINARGELLGRPVELVHYDDHSDAARSAWRKFQLGGVIAHLGVATHARHRAKGHGRAAVTRIIHECRARARVPQYRAQQANRASLALARALGIDRYATMLAVHLAE